MSNATNSNRIMSLSDNINPQRRIRRRRPKSPRSLKYMTNNLIRSTPVSSNFSFGFGDRENTATASSEVFLF